MIFLSLSVFSAGLTAKEQPVRSAGYRWYPRYVTFLPADKADSVLAYAATDLVPVIYKVDTYSFEAGKQLDSIATLINTIRQDPRVNLLYVWIGGSASPEGPARWNSFLGQQRGEALAAWIAGHTGLPEDKLRVENLGEDWYSLGRFVSLSNLPYKDSISSIIRTEEDPARRKLRLQSLNGGKTWRHMLRNIFPYFRNARMVIVCSAIETAEAVPVAVLTDTLDLPPARISIPEPVPAEYMFLSLKTNLMFAAAGIANAGVEVELGKRWSLDVPVFYSPYDLAPGRKLRVLGIQPELRWWLKSAGEGHFIGLHAHTAGFNVAVNDNGRFQDPNRALWGIGLGYGYSLPLGKRKNWILDFNIGAGFADIMYDAYRNFQNGPMYDSGHIFYWGITRAGVSLSYRWQIRTGSRNGKEEVR